MIDSLSGVDRESASTGRQHLPTDVRGHIVLLHGLGANSWAMWLLARRLRNSGFHVANWGYRSVGQSLGSLVTRFTDKLRRYHDGLADDLPLHVVGHSMGAVILRGAMQDEALSRLRRAVLLCPPNRGSHVASRIGGHLRWLSPAIADLADFPESYVNSIPLEVAAEVGVIAAASDFVVAQESTHLPGQKDHITVPGPHGAVVFRHDVFEQVQHFLQHGQFVRTAEARAVDEMARWKQSGLQSP